MTYDIRIPIFLGLFSVLSGALVFYYVWLINRLSAKGNEKFTIFIAILHIVIMAAGLLVTGFIQWK